MLTLAALDIALLVAELLTFGIVVYGVILLHKLTHSKWPMVKCPPNDEWAINILLEILHESDANAPEPLKGDIKILVEACISHTGFSPGAGAGTTHCECIRLARDHAVAGNWTGCIGELTHGL